MSKLIVEMNMPQMCPCELATEIEGSFYTCFAYYGVVERAVEFDKCVRDGKRPSWCPIKGVLPEQHGDLVDADTVLWGEEVPDSEGIVVPVTIGDVIEGYDVPIVIAAERKDDGK